MRFGLLIGLAALGCGRQPDPGVLRGIALSSQVLLTANETALQCPTGDSQAAELSFEPASLRLGEVDARFRRGDLEGTGTVAFTTASDLALEGTFEARFPGDAQPARGSFSVARCVVSWVHGEGGFDAPQPTYDVQAGAAVVVMSDRVAGNCAGNMDPAVDRELLILTLGNAADLGPGTYAVDGEAWRIERAQMSGGAFVSRSTASSGTIVIGAASTRGVEGVFRGSFGGVWLEGYFVTGAACPR